MRLVWECLGVGLGLCGFPRIIIRGSCARLRNHAHLATLPNTAGLRSPALCLRGGEASMKRIIVLLTLVALVMMVMAVGPAFAQTDLSVVTFGGNCAATGFVEICDVLPE